MRTFSLFVLALSVCLPCVRAKAFAYPVAEELRSTRFQATVGGHSASVAHAATTYFTLSFATSGKTEVSITADSAGYWSKGVEVQPWRWGIRPQVNGRTISFSIPGPVKLSISRPGDHAAGAEMLFLFADAPETDVPKRGDAHLHFYGPGVYHENLDPKSGDSIYLAPGAVIFGALNLWDVENVKVFGRGTIVYDGPQDPDHDEGWMHKRNWHSIVMDHARNIQISGITCIIRSRTWMIQMLGSRHVNFDNIKVIGGCPGNANQDGMDWLGGGDTVIRDCFFRASDDIFALYGNWLGYGNAAQTTPGETVDNILIEDSVLSTSISNVVRVSWPQKIFDSHHFTMKNSDVIHMGMGGCKIPFALLELWDEPGGRGKHEDYTFENIRLENWYSLLQLRHPNASVRDIKLRNIWSLETPSLTPSVLSGDVSGIQLEDVNLGGRVASQDSAVPISVESGSSAPAFAAGEGPHAGFQYSPTAVTPGAKLLFEASGPIDPAIKYEWTFGDGTQAQGRVVHHVFPDAKGTFVDGSGSFRVLLKVTDAAGREDWASQSVVVTDSYAPPAADAADATAGFPYKYYEGTGLKVADLANLMPVASSTAESLNVADRGRPEDYAFVFDGVVDAPVDGGYTFLLMGNDTGELAIDSKVIAVSPAPKPQVCGMTGNMVQVASGAIGLKAGKHAVHVAMTHSTGPDGFAVKWQGPGLALTDVAESGSSSSESNQ